MKEVFLCFFFFFQVFGANVFTQHVDIARTGNNVKEYKLNLTNTNVNTFGKLWTLKLDANVAGQALYVQNVFINNVLYNVLYVYTNNANVDGSPSSIFAIDADRGAIIWQYKLNPNSVSMTSTPTIDAATNTLFFVSKEFNSSNPTLIHAVDIVTGLEKPNSPAPVNLQVAGNGLGNIGGVISFGSVHEDCRPGLLFLNNMVFAGFGGGLPGFHNGAYHGWIGGYTYTPQNGFALQSMFISTPASSAGGVWQAGKGLSSDGNSIFVSTGFGTFNQANNDYAMSFLRLDQTLVRQDFFTPFQFATFSANGQDAGNAGIVVLPGSGNGLLWAGGTKYMMGHLMNATNMGGFNAAANNVLTTLSIPATNPVGQEPVAWDGGAANGKSVFLWPTGSAALQYKYTTNTIAIFETLPALTSGGSLTVTSFGQNQGIVWAWGLNGILYAWNGFDISQGLWNSALNPTRDGAGGVPGHFQFPLAVNAKVYVPTSTATLVAYGPLIQAEVALNFTTQPWWKGSLSTSNVPVGSTLPDFMVSVVDTTGKVISSSWSVTLTIAGGIAQLGGITTVECVAGVATFTGITLPVSGVITLVAQTPTLAPATSSPILVTGNGQFPTANLPIPSQNVLPSNVQGGVNGNPNPVGPAAGTVDPLALGLGIGLAGFICCLVAFFAVFVFYRERQKDDYEGNYNQPTVNLERPIPTIPLNQIYSTRMETVNENRY